MISHIGFSLNGSSLMGGGTIYPYFDTITTLSDGFIAGLNTLDFYIEGNSVTDGFALRTISFTAQPFDAAIPEPGTSVLLIAGIGVMGIYARRRKSISGI
jgi:hypothetical protein